jgi:hypothetical protein
MLYDHHLQPAVSCKALTLPVCVPCVLRCACCCCLRAAKARIEKAEAQGRAREEQMELLQAVRAYMAQARQQAAAEAQAVQQA